jgi:hypothetical protein
MAIINRTQIPDAALLSPDALVAWGLTLLDEIYDGQNLVREAPGVSNPVAAVGEYKDMDRVYRLTGRVNLRLMSGYQSSSYPIWENIVPIGLYDIPPGWLKAGTF